MEIYFLLTYIMCVVFLSDDYFDYRPLQYISHHLDEKKFRCFLSSRNVDFQNIKTQLLQRMNLWNLLIYGSTHLLHCSTQRVIFRGFGLYRIR